MGSYLNPGNFSFRGSLRSKIYVDKSELIAKTNEVLCTEQKYICVSRPRRFGKSMAANMLAAYYDRSENTQKLFQNLAISKGESYSMYSPKSVVEAMLRHKFGTYWNQTETYEALKIYIQMDMDGLKDSVVRMLAGESVSIVGRCGGFT